jgi:hypothetical protein
MMRECDGSGGEKQGERGERRRHPDETEIGSDIYIPKASDCSYDTYEKNNEDP